MLFAGKCFRSCFFVFLGLFFLCFLGCFFCVFSCVGPPLKQAKNMKKTYSGKLPVCKHDPMVLPHLGPVPWTPAPPVWGPAPQISQSRRALGMSLASPSSCILPCGPLPLLSGRRDKGMKFYKVPWAVPVSPCGPLWAPASLFFWGLGPAQALKFYKVAGPWA